MTLRISLDRALPIPIGTQLKGQIEYGILCGALKPGERLPSVRKLAAAKGVALVTVSHVYSALKREGLIAMQPGRGTFVAGDNGDGYRSAGSLATLQRMVDTMVVEALERGFTPAQISRMVTAHLAGRQARRPVVAMVGLFGHATEVYARELTRLLADLSPYVESYTIERLRTDSAERARVGEAELVVTIANRVNEVKALLDGRHPPVRGLTFVAHPETVSRLQALSPNLRLGVISTFAEFLPTMLQGVIDCIAPIQAPLCAVFSDRERVRTMLAQAEAVIYASGSDGVVASVPRGIPAIEYLHAPEPSSVVEVRLLLERLTGMGAQEHRERRVAQTV
jgi:DNA-binding transcriptional regulator YhcF (GntR family)